MHTIEGTAVCMYLSVHGVLLGSGGEEGVFLFRVVPAERDPSRFIVLLERRCCIIPLLNSRRASQCLSVRLSRSKAVIASLLVRASLQVTEQLLRLGEGQREDCGCEFRQCISGAYITQLFDGRP